VVHAIEVGSGQKLWEWVRGYDDASRASDNTVPAGVTLWYGANGVERVLVGDMEGRLWELDALTGQNVHRIQAASCVPDGLCRFAAYDTRGTTTAPQPITSNVAIGRIPNDAEGELAEFAGRNVLLFGTAGANWVPQTVGGTVNVALYDRAFLKPIGQDGVDLEGQPWTAAEARSDAALSGMLQQPDPYPVSLEAPDRIYGTITVSGRTAFVPVASGQVTDPLTVGADLGGKLLLINLGDAPSTGASPVANHSFANFGGVTDINVDMGGGNTTDVVLGAQVSRLSRLDIPNAGGEGPSTARPELTPSGGPSWRLMNFVRRLFEG
jgi:type IV pilus assembly protein PilY1